MCEAANILRRGLDTRERVPVENPGTLRETSVVGPGANDTIRKRKRLSNPGI